MGVRLCLTVCLLAAGSSSKACRTDLARVFQLKNGSSSLCLGVPAAIRDCPQV